MRPIHWRMLYMSTMAVALLVTVFLGLKVGLPLALCGTVWWTVIEIDLLARPKLDQTIRDIVGDVVGRATPRIRQEVLDMMREQERAETDQNNTHVPSEPNLWVGLEEGTWVNPPDHAITMTVTHVSMVMDHTTVVHIDALPAELLIGMVVRQGSRSWGVTEMQTASAERSLSNGISAGLVLVGYWPPPLAGSILVLDTQPTRTEAAEVREEAAEVKAPAVTVYERLLSDEDGAKS